MGHKYEDEKRMNRADKRTEKERALAAARAECGHCGDYGGNWVAVLGDHHVGWAQLPDIHGDGLGYAMCRCMADG